MQPILLERFPQLASVPWQSLDVARTPVQRIDLDAGEVWVKRDDLTSAVYGGNKVRKLEFILAHARALSATRLITAGAAGSHHALATAVFGRRAGFAVTLVLFPQPLTDHVRDVLLADHAVGAELRYTPRMTMIPPALAGARIAHWRERTHVIAPGGSDPTGTLGYVNALLELDEQIAAGDAPKPATIVVAAGTMGTAAGIAIGLALTGMNARIRAARITSRLVTNERALSNLIRGTCRLLAHHGVRVDPARAFERVQLTHDQVGAGYGVSTDASNVASETFARSGLQLDATYTAKAAADCLAALSIKAPAPILYWHTLSGALPPVAPGRVEDLPEPFRRYLKTD